MSEIVQIVDGFYVMVDDVKAIRRIDDDRCAVWLTGQGATENFLVECSLEDMLFRLGHDLPEEEEDDDTEEFDD